MSKADFRRRQARRRRHQMVRVSRHFPTLIVLLAITLLVGGGVFALYRFVIGKQPSGPEFCPGSGICRPHRLLPGQPGHPSILRRRAH